MVNADRYTEKLRHLSVTQRQAHAGRSSKVKYVVLIAHNSQPLFSQLVRLHPSFRLAKKLCNTHGEILAVYSFIVLDFLFFKGANVKIGFFLRIYRFTMATK